MKSEGELAMRQKTCQRWLHARDESRFHDLPPDFMKTIWERHALERGLCAYLARWRKARRAAGGDGPVLDGAAVVVPVVVPGWRKAPPTVDELRVCRWWWNRESDGYCYVRELLVNDGGEIFDAVEDPRWLGPADLAGEWAPCLPPEAS